MTHRRILVVALGAGLLGGAALTLAQKISDTPAAPPAAPAAAPAAGRTDPDKVVITIGDWKITAEEFENFVSCLPPEVQATARGPGKRAVAEEMVRLKLLANEARMRKLHETERYRRQLEVMRDNVLVGLLLQELHPVLVNQGDVEKYYEANKDKFEKVSARHILVATSKEQKISKDEARAKALQIRARLLKGEDFAAVAKVESDDPSKTEGGRLEPFARGVMVEPFEKAAFSLKIGEISEPVETEFGYHIIRVEKRAYPELDEVREVIADTLRQERFEEMYEQLKKQVNPVFDETYFPPPSKEGDKK